MELVIHYPRYWVLLKRMMNTAVLNNFWRLGWPHVHRVPWEFIKVSLKIIFEPCTWMHAYLQYIPIDMHTVFALLCFVVVIRWLIFPYPSGLLHWHCGNLTIAPVPAKQPWWIWIDTSCEFIMNNCITTTKQSTTKPCAYFLGYTVYHHEYKRWTHPHTCIHSEIYRIVPATGHEMVDYQIHGRIIMSDRP